MADFIRADLRGSRFEHVDLSGAQLRAVDLTGARLRAVDLTGVVMRNVELAGADIHGEIGNLTINGVDIGPLVDAELDRRYPDRAKMRPADPAGFREAWEVLERLWGQSVERARRLPPELLHESVEGPGWPRPRSYPVRECLLCILSEEWEHRLYAERDLDALRARGA
jgi:hypothetical protein